MKFFLVAIFAAGALCSCETTGDPRQGGIFWSERKAQDRLYEKRETLRRVESDTARRRRAADDDDY